VAVGVGSLLKRRALARLAASGRGTRTEVG
jgi:hypothetical protein